MNRLAQGPTITLIAAVAENGVIGNDGGMPWRLSSDLKRFKADTIGKPVIMGRKTFQSIGKPLPARDNIVITCDSGFRPDGVVVVSSVAEALKTAHDFECHSGAGDIAVIGGGEIYRQTFEHADRIILTRVFAKPVGDTVFPDIDPAIWEQIEAQDVPAGEKDSHLTRRIILHRRNRAK